MIHAIGGAENLVTTSPVSGTDSYVVSNSLYGSLSSSPNLGSTRAYKTSLPGGGGAASYGFTSKIPDTDKMNVMFKFRLEDLGNVAIVIMNLADSSPTNQERRLVVTSDGELQLWDKGDNVIGTTGTSYFTLDTDYWILFHYDRTGTTVDKVWTFKDGDSDWNLEIDESGYGSGGITLGTLLFGGIGKGLPADAAVYYVAKMAFQDLATAPHTTPIGSIDIVVKYPTGNGTDQDFDSGSPSYLDVDEAPDDTTTTMDVADASGEKNSYTLPTQDGGETMLAIFPIGQAAEDSSTTSSVRAYLYDGTTRDYAPAYNIFHQPTGWRQVQNVQGRDTKTFNSVNGVPVSTLDLSDLEVGFEAVTVPASRSIYLTQIGVIYAIEGNRALPSDFPVADTATYVNSYIGPSGYF